MNTNLNRLKFIIILNAVIMVDLIIKTLFFYIATDNLFFTTCIIIVSYIIKVLVMMYFEYLDKK